MKAKHFIGLGEPTPQGKKALFQPGLENDDQYNKERNHGGEASKQPPRKRLRTTVELTDKAFMIIQQQQSEYRLRTGSALTISHLICKAIEAYGNQNDPTHTAQPEPALHNSNGKGSV